MSLPNSSKTRIMKNKEKRMNTGMPIIHKNPFLDTSSFSMLTTHVHRPHKGYFAVVQVFQSVCNISAGDVRQTANHVVLWQKEVWEVTVFIVFLEPLDQVQQTNGQLVWSPALRWVAFNIGEQQHLQMMGRHRLESALLVAKCLQRAQDLLPTSVVCIHAV